MATSTLREESATAASRHRRSTAALLAGLPVLGGALIAVSYRVAADSSTGYSEFHVFWVGYFLVFGPIAWLVFTGPTTGFRRTLLLSAAGLAAYLPHFLRAPTRPFLNDELAHYLQAQQMYATGRLFLPNPIVAQAANYPGLETLTVALRNLTNLGTYQVGMIVIATMHITVVLCMYQLARTVVGARAASVAALVYSVGPQFGFVDSLYAYESLGLPLCVGALAAAATASRESRLARRRALLALTALLLTGCIFTHHLSSYVALFGLFVLTLTWAVRPPEQVGRAAAGMLGAIVVSGTIVAYGWVQLRHADTGRYLTVYLDNGIKSLSNTIAGSSHQDTNGYTAIAASRTPLSSADKPGYEIVATYLAQLLLIICAVAGAWRRRRDASPTWVLAVVFSALYFLSLPLLLTAGGQNAAHRSWAFTYIGLALTVAVGFDVLRTQLWRSRSGVAKRRWRTARTQAAVGTAVILVLLLGAWGAGINTFVAFPGPFVFQSDGRNVPGELYDLASWFQHTEGPGNVVLADYRTSVILTTMGEQIPDVRDAAALIIPDRPTPQAVATVRAVADYIVVDDRLATDVSSEGYYFWAYEPLADQPLPAANIERVSDYPWLRTVHRTEHYTVYQVVR